MRGFVAQTDHEWFTFLRAEAARPEAALDDANFWRPSAQSQFRAIPEGSPFFFHLKSPHYAIGGYGVYVGQSLLPAWRAWEAFGVGNGAPDFETMRRRIERYRQPAKPDPGGHYQIRCLMVAAPVFFDEPLWVRDPVDWSSNIVQGKTYDLTGGEGLRISQECMERARAAAPAPALALHEEVAEARARYGHAQIVLPRLGQGSFKVAVTDAYGRACAVTTEHSLPVLDAAHIRPYAQGGEHRISNGILLRTDIHRLFDKGYVTVTPEYRFEVSHELRDEWENGRVYYELHGKEIQLPEREGSRPDQAALQWHNEEMFRAD